MIESVEARFSTFVHPNIWVARSDIPPALERQGGFGRCGSLPARAVVNRPVPERDAGSTAGSAPGERVRIERASGNGGRAEDTGEGSVIDLAAKRHHQHQRLP